VHCTSRGELVPCKSLASDLQDGEIHQKEDEEEF
jgi:hypothetical protein